MYVIATVICPNFHFSVSPHVPFLNLLFEQIAIPTSIYLQNLASIQPEDNPVYLGDLYTESGQTLQGSFSAVSTPIFTTKYSFFSIFRDLQDFLAEFSKFVKICQILSKF